MDWNIAKWQPTQWAAAGRQTVTFISGGVAAAVAIHFISPAIGTDLTGNINDISQGATQLAKGVLGLVATITAIRNAFKSSTKASPSEQVKSVIQNLSASQITQAANATQDPTSRDKLIVAVSQMPEVKAVVADTPAATHPDIPKVVLTAQEAQTLH